jgi:hypothetical protein
VKKKPNRKIDQKVRRTSDSLPTALRESPIWRQLDAAEKAASGLREAVRIELEARIRSLGCVEPVDLAEGRAISHRINVLLSTHGLRFRFPGSDRPATLNFLVSLRSKPGEFFLRSNTKAAVSLHGDFSAIELTGASPRRLRTPKSGRQKKGSL